MEAISDLPMLHDLDADYSPQYIKLARIVRDRIEADHYQHGQYIPASALAHEFKVSMRVAENALLTLAANRYVARLGRFKPHQVDWQPGR
jgi:DNA-binding GntR family transcriptional regulator